jgi:plastocyanin
MRLAIRLLGPALLLSLLAVGCASQPASSPAPAVAGTQISIKGFAFNPNQPSVAKGATITWSNDDGTTHTVTSGVPGTLSGKFDQRVEPGKTFSFTFSEIGTFDFFCNIHNSMRGTITVR